MEWFSQVVIVNVDDFGASPPSAALSRVCCYAFQWKYRRPLENHKVDSHSQCNVAESEGRDLTFSTTLCLAQLKNKSQLFECKYDLLQGWIYLLSTCTCLGRFIKTIGSHLSKSWDLCVVFWLLFFLFDLNFPKLEFDQCGKLSFIVMWPQAIGGPTTLQ